MIYFFILFFLVCCYGMKVSSFHKDFMSIETTTCIKGVFAVFILFSHIKGYLTLDLNNWEDKGFVSILSYLGQLIVSVYFFYSGYGIFESVRKKNHYVKSFFRNRIFKTLVHFDLAVLLFLIVQSCLGNWFETQNYVLCWVGWLSIGNSNWFIFDLLSVYLLTLGILYLREVHPFSLPVAATMVTLFSCALWVFLRFAKTGEYWWYDTLLTFPAGMWFSCILYSPLFDKIIHRDWSRYSLVLIVSVFFVFWRHFWGIDQLGICSILFALTVSLFSTHLKFGNQSLHWLGEHCFSIYILQRLPMIVFSHFGLAHSKYLFAGAVIPCTLLIAWGFTHFTNYLDIIIKKR